MTPTSGRTYYLDAINGDDGNLGTDGSPWRTLAKAQSIASAGDTVYLRSGNYGAFTDNTSNRSGWVTYKSVTGENPILTYIDLGRWDGPYDLYLVFDGMTITPGPHPGGRENRAIRVISAEYLKFENLKIYSETTWDRNDGSAGIFIGSNSAHIWIDNCDITDYACGIYGYNSGSDDVNAINCTVYDCFWPCIIVGSKWVVSGCDFSDVQDGINISGPNCIIQDCNIHDFKTPDLNYHADGIQLYSTGEWIPNDFMARRNSICTKSHHGFGIRGLTGAPLERITLENNVVWDTTTTMVDLRNLDTVTVRGNTFVKGRGGGSAAIYAKDVNDLTICGNIMRLVGYENVTFAYCDYNIYYKQSAGSPLPGSHNIMYGVDNEASFKANFVDHDANDFNLIHQSVCIDYCPLDKMPTLDLTKRNRVDIAGKGHDGSAYADAGCYEYVGTGFRYAFDEGDCGFWRVVDEGSSCAPSSWSASGSTMVQSSNIYAEDGVALDKRGTYAVCEQGIWWDDYRMSLTMKSDDDDSMGMMFRYQDENNYYRFSWDRQRCYRRLVMKKDGRFTLLAEDNVAYVIGRMYQVEIVACGPVQQVFMDGELILKASDRSFQSGSIGLYSWADEGAYFGDLTVQQISSSEGLTDDFDDGDYSGWKVVDEGTSYAPSSWSAVSGAMVQNSNIFGGDGVGLDIPGTYALYEQGICWDDYRVRLSMKSQDDDAVGVMFRYQDRNNYYRFSWDGQRSYRKLVKKEKGLFTLLAQDKVPYVAGRTYQVEIVAFGPALQVLVDGAPVLKASDTSFQSGSIALYSWGNEGTYFDDLVVQHIAPWELAMDVGDVNLWMVVDEGTRDAPSSWSAAGGVMVQSSNIYGGDGITLDKPGTCALYQGGISWEDYRVGLSLKSDDDDGIGIMFRYQDRNNYYRFSWDRQRCYRRLIKKEDGVFTLLDIDNVPYAVGQTYQVEVVACGDILQVFIDGRLILSASDHSLKSGSIALYSWGNVGSYFSDVVVKGI